MKRTLLRILIPFLIFGIAGFLIVFFGLQEINKPFADRPVWVAVFVGLGMGAWMSGAYCAIYPKRGTANASKISPRHSAATATGTVDSQGGKPDADLRPPAHS